MAIKRDTNYIISNGTTKSTTLYVNVEPHWMVSRIRVGSTFGALSITAEVSEDGGTTWDVLLDTLGAAWTVTATAAVANNFSADPAIFLGVERVRFVASGNVTGAQTFTVTKVKRS